MKFPLHQPTIRLLRGLKGVELGASAHNPYGVDAINISPDLNRDFFDQAQIDLCGETAHIDLTGHAADIPVLGNSQDFVLSSHVLEHAPDLLAAFLEIDRVVKPGGYIVTVFPQPGALPEDTRPLSTVGEIWYAHMCRWTFDTAPDDAVFRGKGGHYWKMKSDQFIALVRSLYSCRPVEGWPGLKWRMIGCEDPDTKVGNGFWTAYQKEKS